MSAFFQNLDRCTQRFARSEDGPSAVEYAVLLALIVLVAAGAIRSVGESVLGVWQVIDTAVRVSG